MKGIFEICKSLAKSYMISKAVVSILAFVSFVCLAFLVWPTVKKFLFGGLIVLAVFLVVLLVLTCIRRRKA